MRRPSIDDASLLQADVSRPPANTTGSHALSGPALRVGRSPRCQAATRTPGGQYASTCGNARADVLRAHPSYVDRRRISS